MWYPNRMPDPPSHFVSPSSPCGDSQYAAISEHMGCSQNEGLLLVLCYIMAPNI